MIYSKVDPYNHVCVLDVLFSIGPCSYASTTSRLVGVLAACIQLSVLVFSNVDVVIGELGSLVMEAVAVCQHLLECWCVDLVRHWLAVDRIPDCSVLNLEDSVLLVIGVEAARFLNYRLLHVIANAMRVEVGAWHGMSFVVHESVVVAVDRWVDTKGEDVLMMGSKYARVYHCAPGHFNAFVDRLSAEDTGGANLVDDLACLVEHESKDVLVVRNGDDGLKDQLSVSDQGRSPSSVIDVLPTNSCILLVHTNRVLHWYSFSLAVRKHGTEVVDRAQAVAAELEIVRHDTSTGIAQVESSLLMERMPWVSVGYIHVRERKAVKQTSSVISNLPS